MYLTEKCQEPIIGVWARAGGEGVGAGGGDGILLKRRDETS